MSFHGKLTLSGQGTGTFQYQGISKSLLIFKIFGETKKEIRQKAREILKEVIATAGDDRTDEYKKDFSELPKMAYSRLAKGDDWDFDLPYDPCEALGGASWGIYNEPVAPIVVVLQ